MSGRLARFCAFSAELTAWSVFDLRGTGLAETYLDTADDIVGRDVVDALLDRFDCLSAAAEVDGGLPVLLRRDLLSDPKLGPVARNVIKLWYVGIWYELPRAWTEAYGARRGNVTFTVTPAAYVEGLLWPTIGANPPGAKAPGYGSWTQPPRIPAFG